MLTCHFRHTMVLKGWLHLHEHHQSARHAGHLYQEVRRQHTAEHSLIPLSTLPVLDLGQWEKKVLEGLPDSREKNNTGLWKVRHKKAREAARTIKSSNQLNPMKELIVTAVVSPLLGNKLFPPKGPTKETEDEVLEVSGCRRVTRYPGFQSGATQTLLCIETLRPLSASISSSKWRWYCFPERCDQGF